MTSFDKGMAIAICAIMFLAGMAVTYESQEQMLDDYEDELEWQVKRYHALENLISEGEGLPQYGH